MNPRLRRHFDNKNRNYFAMVKGKKSNVDINLFIYFTFWCCLFKRKKKTVLNLRMAHAKKLLWRQQSARTMFSCEYIRILKYFMYISITER